MYFNTIFLIFVISFSLSNTIETNKNCLVKIEIEYDEDYESFFDQFAEIEFDEEEKEDTIPTIGEEEILNDDEEDDDEYPKVDQFIPSNMKNCKDEIMKSSKIIQHQFKQLRNLFINNSLH